MSTVLQADEIERTLRRMAHQVIEGLGGLQGVCLVGIQSGGVLLAKRLAKIFKETEGVDVPVGSLDIAFYRDDITKRKEPPRVKKTEISFNIEDMKVILVDDVLYTGRSIRAAMDALMDLGRPERICLAVFIDRGGRQLPICPDFVGKSMEVPLDRRVEVLVRPEPSADDRVELVEVDSEA